MSSASGRFINNMRASINSNNSSLLCLLIDTAEQIILKPIQYSHSAFFQTPRKTRPIQHNLQQYSLCKACLSAAKSQRAGGASPVSDSLIPQSSFTLFKHSWISVSNVLIEFVYWPAPWNKSDNDLWWCYIGSAPRGDKWKLKWPQSSCKPWLQCLLQSIMMTGTDVTW